MVHESQAPKRSADPEACLRLFCQILCVSGSPRGPCDTGQQAHRLSKRVRGGSCARCSTWSCMQSTTAGGGRLPCFRMWCVIYDRQRTACNPSYLGTECFCGLMRLVDCVALSFCTAYDIVKACKKFSFAATPHTKPWQRSGAPKMRKCCEYVCAWTLSTLCDKFSSSWRTLHCPSVTCNACQWDCSPHSPCTF